MNRYGPNRGYDTKKEGQSLLSKWNLSQGNWGDESNFLKVRKTCAKALRQETTKDIQGDNWRETGKRWGWGGRWGLILLELKGHVEAFSLYNKYKNNKKYLNMNLPPIQYCKVEIIIIIHFFKKGKKKKYLNSFMAGCNMLRFSILKDSSIFNVVKRLERCLI